MVSYGRGFRPSPPSTPSPQPSYYSQQGTPSGATQQAPQAPPSNGRKYTTEQKTYYEVRDIAKKIDELMEKVERLELENEALKGLLQANIAVSNSLLTVLNTVLQQINQQSSEEEQSEGE